jgi:hypothetical protein
LARSCLRMLLKSCSCRFPEFTSLYTDYQLYVYPMLAVVYQGTVMTLL